MPQSAIIIVSILGSLVALLSVAVVVLFRSLVSVNNDIALLGSAMSAVCQAVENIYNNQNKSKNE